MSVRKPLLNNRKSTSRESHYKRTFSDGTRNTRITRYSRSDVYKCEAEGQPKPDVAWLLVHDIDDRAEIVSAHALLNVTTIVRHVDDVTSLRCFASNAVAGTIYSQSVELAGN